MKRAWKKIREWNDRNSFWICLFIGTYLLIAGGTGMADGSMWGYFLAIEGVIILLMVAIGEIIREGNRKIEAEIAQMDADIERMRAKMQARLEEMAEMKRRRAW